MKAVYVVRCIKDENDCVIGTYHHNPILDSMIYYLEFSDEE